MLHEHLHLSKPHHLECVNIPETINNSMWLCFSFCFQSVLHKLLIIEKEHKSSSQQVLLLKAITHNKLMCNYNSHVWLKFSQFNLQ